MKRKPIKLETFHIQDISGEWDFVITHDFEEKKAFQLKDLLYYSRDQRGEMFIYHSRSKDENGRCARCQANGQWKL